MAYLRPAARRYLYEYEDLRAYTARTFTRPEELEPHLAGVREKAYAIERGERFEGAWGIAVPILGSDEKPILAILCVGSLPLDDETEAEVRSHMLATAQSISDHLALVGDLPKPAVDFARFNLE